MGEKGHAYRILQRKYEDMDEGGRIILRFSEIFSIA